MSMTVLLDAGPLVAYMSERDEWHDWAVTQFASLRPPLSTCEPVLAEACFVVQRNGGQPAALRSGLELRDRLG